MADVIERHFEFKLPKISPHVIEFTAREAVSNLFEFKITCAHKDQIKFDDVIGKEALLIIPGIESERHVHGMVNQFIQVGHFGARLLQLADLLHDRRQVGIFLRQARECAGVGGAFRHQLRQFVMARQDLVEMDRCRDF